MKPTTIKLLKENPEAFKEVAIGYGMYYCTHESFKDEKVWNSFLSEALKPDWEILEFKDVKHTYIKYNLQSNGFYSDNSNGEADEFSLTDILNGEYSVRDGKISIHSVRRSDGEVFKEEERTNDGVIKHFFIHNDKMLVDCDGLNGLGPYALNELTKLKPLFKTEDGKDYYRGDTLIPVRVETLTIEPETNIYYGFIPAGHVVFSTRSAAEQWVNDHRPSVSIAQIREFAEKDLPFQTVEALLLHLKSKK